MSKKMRTRLGQDGYNYPYTHEDLIFNNDMVPLSQKLSETKDRLDEVDEVLETKASAELVNTMQNETQGKFDEVDGVLETKASTEFVNTVLDGLRLMQITRSDYDALETKDPSTLYIII